MVRTQKKEDDDKRVKELNGAKGDFLVGTAVRIKVSWLADGAITSEEYDTFSSQAIYDLLRSGRPEKTIHPREVVRDYDLHRQEL